MALAPPITQFDEIYDFLISAPSLEQIANFEPSEQLQQRLDELLEKNREEGLDESEKAELDEFLRINRFMSRLRLKARQKLKKP